MILPEIPFTGWVREKDYPTMSRQSGVLSVTDKFVCPASAFEIQKLEELESFTFEGLTVNNASAQPNDNSAHWHITVIYGVPNSSQGSAAKDGVSEYSMEDSGQEIPIDTRKQNGDLWFSKYKTRWNYALAAKKGVTTVPGMWNLASDTTLDDETAANYKWVKDISDVPDKWKILKEKTKRIESVIAPNPVVVEVTKYQNYNQAVAKRQTIGTKKTPAKTFGLSGDFLVMSSNVSFDGKRWMCQTRYQNAPEWDSDFYN